MQIMHTLPAQRTNPICRHGNLHGECMDEIVFLSIQARVRPMAERHSRVPHLCAPSKDQQRLMDALSDGPGTISELGVEINRQQGKIQDILSLLIDEGLVCELHSVVLLNGKTERLFALTTTSGGVLA